ncbi:MAG: ATP-binding cassette domain-containing protein [Acidimicrobiales bacterium]
MIGHLRLELSRTIRDGRYVLLAVAAPVGFYLLFSAVFGGKTSGPNTTFGLPAAKEIMVAMATFGAMWGALSATAPRLARDREGGWLDYLATTPLRPGRVLVARVLAGVLVALPALVAVGIAAVAAHGVGLAAWQWAAGLGLLWVGTVPFVVLGIAVGRLTSSTVAYALSTGLWFALGALGGLWVPPGTLSAPLRHVAEALPSYNQAALGWHVVAGNAPTAANAAILAAWTVGLALLPLVVHRRRAHRLAAGTASHEEAWSVALCGITERFGTVQALDGIELAIHPGETVALLGPNGSGKTTTISILLGLLYPDHGTARLFGTAPRRAALVGQVGVMLQDCELMAGVGVGELVRFIGALYPDPAELATLVDAADLSGLLGRRTDKLSGGQARRVQFALAMAGNPALLVLDEPTAAMDVRARQDLWHALHRQVEARGTTVLFSTHDLHEADEHAERVVLVRAGRIVADGPPDQVKAAAGSGRAVRFRVLLGPPERFRDAAAVTALDVEGSRVTQHTSDADATVWSLYDQREFVSDLQVSEGTLEEAFLNLTAANPA